MRADLRPSSLGEILDRTAQMYRSHFLLYFGIASVSYAGVLALTVLANLLVYPHAHGNPRTFAGLSVVAGGTAGLLAFLPVTIAMAAVMHAVAQNYLGRVCTIRAAYLSILHRWYRYILILLAIYLYGFLPIGLLVGVVAVCSTLLPPGLGRVTVVAIAVILMLVGLFFAFWWMLRWALSIPASLMENLPVHRALKRSSVLTKGGVGRIFVMLLLVVVMMTIIQYAVQIPAFLLLWKSRGVISLSTRIVTSIGSSLSGAFVLPIYSIALTLFYYDQRIRKEGFDVEWLMAQAMESTLKVAPPTLPSPLAAEPESPGPSI
jgi:hypothetical protein